MTDHTGMLALGPVRGAIESLEQALALPELAADLIVIVGDESAVTVRKRETYHEIFTALGRARRPVLWIPGPVDCALEHEVHRAYETAKGHPAPRHAEVVLFTPDNPPADLGTVTNELLDELLQTFKPRFAARVERPALYVLRDHGGSEWLEV